MPIVATDLAYYIIQTGQETSERVGSCKETRNAACSIPGVHCTRSSSENMFSRFLRHCHENKNKYHTWYSSNNHSCVPGGYGFPIYQYQVPGNRHPTSVRDGKSYTLLSTSYTDYLDRVTFAVRLHAPWDVCIGDPISSQTCGTHTQRTCRFGKIWPRYFHRYVARRLLCTRCRENELQICTRYEGVRCGALSCVLPVYQYTVLVCHLVRKCKERFTSILIHNLSSNFRPGRYIRQSRPVPTHN